MAGRPDYWKREEILSREELNTLRERLTRLNQTGVLEFYKRACQTYRIISGNMYPTAEAMQELVQAWKRLRKRVWPS